MILPRGRVSDNRGCMAVFRGMKEERGEACEVNSQGGQNSMLQVSCKHASTSSRVNKDERSQNKFKLWIKPMLWVLQTDCRQVWILRVLLKCPKCRNWTPDESWLSTTIEQVKEYVDEQCEFPCFHLVGWPQLYVHLLQVYGLSTLRNKYLIYFIVWWNIYSPRAINLFICFNLLLWNQCFKPLCFNKQRIWIQLVSEYRKPGIRKWTHQKKNINVSLQRRLNVWTLSCSGCIGQPWKHSICSSTMTQLIRFLVKVYDGK